jgi:hypothetical protein
MAKAFQMPPSQIDSKLTVSSIGGLTASMLAFVMAGALPMLTVMMLNSLGGEGLSLAKADTKSQSAVTARGVASATIQTWEKRWRTRLQVIFTKGLSNSTNMTLASEFCEPQVCKDVVTCPMNDVLAYCTEDC